jgi:hypothetical protein
VTDQLTVAAVPSVLDVALIVAVIVLTIKVVNVTVAVLEMYPESTAYTETVYPVLGDSPVTVAEVPPE